MFLAMALCTPLIFLTLREQRYEERKEVLNEFLTILTISLIFP